jgi:phospholipase/lecithinase/hemolysin/regulation of enolase protein 1 (concanavalin A-like superfamily)
LKFVRAAYLLSLWSIAFIFPFSLGAQVQVDHMVVFGDSLSDNGNLYSVIHLPGPPTYSLGRSTDGPDSYPASAISGLWEEQLASSLGLLIPQPDLISSANLNFAFSGAESGDLANSATGPYGMALQVESYLQHDPGNIATALHVFWGGTNDVFDYPDPPSAAQGSVENIGSQISSIAAAGGKYFVWLNLSPLEASPRGAGRSDIGTATAAFSLSTQDAIATLPASYPNIVIVPVDIYSLYKQVVQSPAQFGLTNVTTPAQGLAVNPDQYIFWDGLHPTTKMHQIIANLARTDIQRRLNLTPAPVKTLVSDEFASAGVNPDVWTVEAPPDATVTVANDHLVLSLPAGANHDAFLGGDHAARILQTVSNADLDVSAKFDSVLNAAYEGQGIMVQQDDQTYLRFEVSTDGTQSYLTGGSVGGGAETNFFSSPLPSQGSPLWLEVKRTGDTWSLNSSTDGVNYTTAGVFSQKIAVSAIGPYAWNYNGNTSLTPAVTSQIDYFHSLAPQ